MEKFEEPLISGEKNRTNRAFSKSRNKISIGDTAQIKVGNRFKGLKQLFDAIIIDKILWSYEQAPKNDVTTWLTSSPRRAETWVQFAIKDGFEDYESFLEYFDPESHPKKQSKYIFFEFERVEEYYVKNYVSLEVFMKC